MNADPPAPDDSSLHLARLPTGRHGLPREFVAGNHRDRLIAGCIAAVEERGYADFTVADVIKQAAVSRRTFYEHFSSKDDCFIATYDVVVAHVRRSVEAALAGAGEWPGRVRDAFARVLQFVAADPALARLCMVEPLAAGGAVAAHHGAAIECLARLLAADRPSPAASSATDSGAELATVAGIVSLLCRRVASGEAKEVERLLPDLVESYLSPVLGTAEAERIARE
jgi:AcrR family transcriptional regulator